MTSKPPALSSSWAWQCGFKVSPCKETGWGTRKAGWKGTFSHLKRWHPAEWALWRRNRSDSWSVHLRRTMPCLRVKSQPLPYASRPGSAAQCFPRREGTEAAKTSTGVVGREGSGKALREPCRWSQRGLLCVSSVSLAWPLCLCQKLLIVASFVNMAMCFISKHLVRIKCGLEVTEMLGCLEQS